MALVLITHDLALVAEAAHKIIVMYAGQVVETGDAKDIFRAPRHPYTQHLIHSLPMIGDKTSKASLSGAPPNLANPPSGCRFHPRCPYVMDICKTEAPAMKTVANRHRVACYLAEETAA